MDICEDVDSSDRDDHLGQRLAARGSDVKAPRYVRKHLHRGTYNETQRELCRSIYAFVQPGIAHLYSSW